MRRVFICSRYAGDIESNIKRAQALCRYVAYRGEAPFAPHLLFPQFMADSGVERMQGLKCGMAFLEHCDLMLVDTSKGVSDGMESEISRAMKLHIPIEYTSVELP